MKIFREHFFYRLRHQPEGNKKLYLAFTARALVALVGALIFAILPIMGSYYYGGESNAGLVIAFFTFLQILLFAPLSGYYIDRKGAHMGPKIGIVSELIGSALFLSSPNKWTFLAFCLGLYIRWTFFNLDPLILQLVNRKKGGFWFGFRDEVISVGNFIAVFLFPYFIFHDMWIMAAVISVVNSLVCLWILREVTQPGKLHSQTSLLDSINMVKIVKKGMHFVRVNHRFPLFTLGTKFFQGTFYGAIWFLFPLHLFRLAHQSNGLTLGIHEIVTICFAIVCGIIADRLDWKKLEEYAWIFMLMLVWLLPFWNSPLSLIVIGFFIGMANNFFASASYHALTKYNQDHKEDGSFSAFSKAVQNLGYMISPIVCGYLYEYYEFHTAMVYVASVITVIGVWMIGLCFLLKNTEKELVYSD